MKSSHETVVIFSTVPPAESERLARALVERRLAACVNITPVRSYYRWKGEFCCDEEHLLIVKTPKKGADKVIAGIKALHSYEVPEIIAVPVIAGHPPYLEWVHGETRGDI
jgi:periplasmic divalent cation tolerance protein